MDQPLSPSSFSSPRISCFWSASRTPDKFVFDEVHYVPAARRWTAYAEPMLNPMHPPLAKQLIAVSIRTFGDNPLGWRYPGVLFGALAVVANLSLRIGAVRGMGPRPGRPSTPATSTAS